MKTPADKMTRVPATKSKTPAGLTTKKQKKRMEPIKTMARGKY